MIDFSVKIAGGNNVLSLKIRGYAQLTIINSMVLKCGNIQKTFQFRLQFSFGEAKVAQLKIICRILLYFVLEYIYHTIDRCP